LLGARLGALLGALVGAAVRLDAVASMTALSYFRHTAQ
jgi:hypothetical protein